MSVSVSVLQGPQVKDATRDAVSRGFDAVAVGGGDGTLSSAAEVLSGGRVPLGVLPLGTLNHFARDLGVPANLGEAARIIARRGPRWSTWAR